jgi:hypothetical protein
VVILLMRDTRGTLAAASRLQFEVGQKLPDPIELFLRNKKKIRFDKIAKRKWHALVHAQRNETGGARASFFFG